MAPSRRPPPPLMAELVEEILLRLPPGDPASLVRAALVCKPWCRIVSGRRFRRRFREFHRSARARAGPPLQLQARAPLLRRGRRVPLRPPRLLPRRPRLPPQLPPRIDARHGRVLLRGMVWEDDDLRNDDFAVWDPVTGEEQTLPPLPRYAVPNTWNAAVLCAAHPSGACDHLDCHRGPFLVVVVDSEVGETFVHVYSSEAGSWSEQAVPRLRRSASWLWPSFLVGNSLCFMLRPRRSILKYNVGTGEICVIGLPPTPYKPDVLVATEDGRLGFAAVHKSRLYLWSSENGAETEVGWTQSRVIQLHKLLPADALRTSPTVVGFADGSGIVFLGTKFGVFSINLKSQRQAKNVYERNHCNVLPYMSFCTPAVGAACTGQEPNEGASSA